MSQEYHQKVVSIAAVKFGIARQVLEVNRQKCAN